MGGFLSVAVAQTISVIHELIARLGLGAVPDGTPTEDRIRDPLLARLRSFGGNWILIFLGLFAAQGINALSLVYLARLTTPERYAFYISSVSLLSLTIVLPGLGLETWLLVRAASSEEQLRRYWGTALDFRLRALFLWLLAVLPLVLVLPQDRYPPRVFLLVALALAVESITALSYVAFRVRGKHGTVTLLQVVQAVSLLVVVVTLPASADRVDRFAAWRVIVAVTEAILALLLSAYGGVGWPILGRQVAHHLKDLWSFSLSDVAVATYHRADLTLITLLLGNAAAGAYGPALNVVNMTFMVPRALFLLATPLLSRQFHLSRQRYQRLGWGQMSLQVVVGLGMTLVLLVFSPVIVQTIFGAQYIGSTDILQLLSVVPLLKATNFGLAAFLVTSDYQKQRTVVQLISALLNAVGTYVAVQQIGLRGAAYVYILSEAVLLVGYGLFTIRLSSRTGDSA